MSNKYKLTIFTATFNRAYIINTLYESLKKQTIKDFEWIVVDDGSSDNTTKLFKTYHNWDKSFPIKFKSIEHGGKHRCINMGLDMAESELFYVVDSDDYLPEKAVENILKWENSIQYRTSFFCGIAGLKCYPNGKPVGKTFPGQYLDVQFHKKAENGIIGDKAYVFYTDIFRKYKYPEFDNEYHVPPSVSMVRMAAKGYYIRYFNESTAIVEYLNDGLTKTGDKKILNNFKGYTLRALELLELDISFKRKLEIIGRYSHLARISSKPYREISQNVKTPALFCLILGLIAKLLKKFERKQL